MNKSALLVIDVQNGMFNGDEQPYEGEKVLARIGDLVMRARATAIPVIFVQHDGGAEHYLEKPHDGWRIHPATGYRDGDCVVEKRFCDSFQETQLDQLLKEKNILKIVVAGMATDYCIDTSCRSAFSLGYKVVLASDAHTTFSHGALSAEQIVQHHNTILGSEFVTTRITSEINFQHVKNENNE